MSTRTMVDDPIARLIREAGPRPGAPAERADRVRSAVHARWRSHVGARRSRRRLMWLLVPAAAAASWLLSSAPRSPRPTPAAVVELVSGGVFVDDTAPSLGQSVSSVSTLSTAARSRVALRLSSGVSLRLDQRTRLRFIAADRLYLESGAVYVDSHAGAGMTTTFIETPLGEARDVGTQFEVRVSEQTLLVRVREGAVRVAGARERLDALAGEEVELGRRGSVARREILPYAGEWDWIQTAAPAFELEGRSLDGFLDWAARELGLRVRFDASPARENASGIHLEGSLEGLSPREALDVVIPSAGLAHRIEDGVLIVSERN